MATPSPTGTEYSNLDRAFDWFNNHLFDGKLPSCLITFQRDSHARGFYWPDKFRSRRGKSTGRQQKPEIALNPDYFPNRKDQDVMSTLVHEMVHHWQAYFGQPGRGSYHNRQWAAKMIEVGLMPSSTGRRGGDKTGDRMTHYLIRNGAFSKAWGALYRTGFRIGWHSFSNPFQKGRNKQKFSCPSCGINVWGADSLVGCVACVSCTEILIAAN